MDERMNGWTDGQLNESVDVGLMEEWTDGQEKNGGAVMKIILHWLILGCPPVRPVIACNSGLNYAAQQSTNDVALADCLGHCDSERERKKVVPQAFSFGTLFIVFRGLRTLRTLRDFMVLRFLPALGLSLEIDVRFFNGTSYKWC